MLNVLNTYDIYENSQFTPNSNQLAYHYNLLLYSLLGIIKDLYVNKRIYSHDFITFRVIKSTQFSNVTSQDTCILFFGGLYWIKTSAVLTKILFKPL